MEKMMMIDIALTTGSDPLLHQNRTELKLYQLKISFGCPPSSDTTKLNLLGATISLINVSWQILNAEVINFPTSLCTAAAAATSSSSSAVSSFTFLTAEAAASWLIFSQAVTAT